MPTANGLAPKRRKPPQREPTVLPEPEPEPEPQRAPSPERELEPEPEQDWSGIGDLMGGPTGNRGSNMKIVTHRLIAEPQQPPPPQPQPVHRHANLVGKHGRPSANKSDGTPRHPSKPQGTRVEAQALFGRLPNPRFAELLPRAGTEAHWKRRTRQQPQDGTNELVINFRLDHEDNKRHHPNQLKGYGCEDPHKRSMVEGPLAICGLGSCCAKPIKPFYAIMNVDGVTGTTQEERERRLEKRRQMLNPGRPLKQPKASMMSKLCCSKPIKEVDEQRRYAQAVLEQAAALNRQADERSAARLEEADEAYWYDRERHLPAERHRHRQRYDCAEIWSPRLTEHTAAARSPTRVVRRSISRSPSPHTRRSPSPVSARPRSQSRSPVRRRVPGPRLRLQRHDTHAEVLSSRMADEEGQEEPRRRRHRGNSQSPRALAMRQELGGSPRGRAVYEGEEYLADTHGFRRYPRGIEAVVASPSIRGSVNNAPAYLRRLADTSGRGDVWAANDGYGHAVGAEEDEVRFPVKLMDF